ncbi:SulP family inorganic anion transporter [Kaarinaea lacus]
MSWIKLLDESTVRKDIIAGITAGILILPQAIALATLAGMPPEYGLYTSIFPVIIAALYGSSWHSMSGPNTALCILISATVANYATKSTVDWIQYTITLTFMAAVIQLFFGFFRLGVIFNYFSHTVMQALVAGVGITIILQQLGSFMGVVMNLNEDIDELLLQIIYVTEIANIYAVVVGLATVVSGLVIRKYYPRLPYLIIAIVVGMACGASIDVLFGSATAQLDKLGTMSLSTLPLSAPDFSPESFNEAAETLIPASFLVAFLGLMQSAVIARSMAVKSGQHVDINQEVIGQGLSNLIGSFLSCFASCSSFNRSASNLDAGAKTPLSAIISVLALAVLVVFAAPVISQMPNAVMAGILILVGLSLIKLDDIIKLLRVQGEARIIFTLTIMTTLIGGLDKAVLLGIVLSIIAYLKSVSKPEFELLFNEEQQQYLPEGIEEGTVAQISGSLFFGSLHSVEQSLTDLGLQNQRKDVLVLSCEHILHIDDAGAEMLVREARKRKEAGGDLFIWLRNHAHDKVLTQAGLVEVIGNDHIRYTSE